MGTAQIAMMTSFKILAASVQFSRSFGLAICDVLVPVPTFRGPGLTLSTMNYNASNLSSLATAIPYG